MPYYAVAKGRTPAVYLNWDDCKSNVNGYSGARYKKFNTKAEAQSFINENGSSSYSSPSASTGYYGSKSSSASTGYYSSRSPSPPIRYSSSVSKPRATQSTAREVRRSVQLSSTAGESRIYVDGACRGNGQNVSGAGIGVYYEDFPSKSVSRAFSEVDSSQPTNQKAELYAMKHAIKNILNESQSEGGLDHKYKIYTDSNYVKNSITTWKDNWKTNGWKNSKGEPVANADIIKEIDADLEAVNKVYRDKNWNQLEFVHVKGHSGDPGNESADKLANAGADKDSRARS